MLRVHSNDIPDYLANYTWPVVPPFNAPVEVSNNVLAEHARRGPCLDNGFRNAARKLWMALEREHMHVLGTGFRGVCSRVELHYSLISGYSSRPEQMARIRHFRYMVSVHLLDVLEGVSAPYGIVAD